MSEHMVEDGYAASSVTNVDISPVVIDQMRKKHPDMDCTLSGASLESMTLSSDLVHVLLAFQGESPTPPGCPSSEMAPLTRPSIRAPWTLSWYVKHLALSLGCSAKRVPSMAWVAHTAAFVPPP
jgi:hypothetical protein